MSWETALRAHLLANVNVQTALGARLYPLSLPPNVVFPACVYALISYASTLEHQPVTSGRALLQLTVWSTIWLQARQTAQALIDALNGARIAAGTQSLCVLPLAERDLADEELNLFGRAVDFLVYITKED